MGCDIHIIIERKHKNIWVPVNPPPPIEPRPALGDPNRDIDFGQFADVNEVEELTQALLPFEDRIPAEMTEWHFWRDYSAFGHVAGVRGGSALSRPKGWPSDWPVKDDGYTGWCHSPTWFTADEWERLCKKHTEFGDDPRWCGLRDAMLKIAADYNINPADVRMVICFDN
jgi:hypothetical protein